MVCLKRMKAVKTAAIHLKKQYSKIMRACKLLLAEYTRNWKILCEGYHALSWTCVLLQLGSLLFNLRA